MNCPFINNDAISVIVYTLGKSSALACFMLLEVSLAQKSYTVSQVIKRQISSSSLLGFIY